MPELDPRTQAILPEAVDNLIGSLNFVRDRMSPTAIINGDDTITWAKTIVKWHGLNPERPEVQSVIDGAWAMVFVPEASKQALLTYKDCTADGLSTNEAVVHTAAVFEPKLLEGHTDPGEDDIFEIEDKPERVSELPLSIAKGVSLIARYANVEGII